MQSSTYCAAAALHILELESSVLKLQSWLNSNEVTDTARARLQTLLAETQAELRSLP